MRPARARLPRGIAVRSLAAGDESFHAAAMTSSALPPCGLYRTVTPVAGVPADTLVYFHNHGDPGPGLYIPEGWSHNRARFSPRGTTVPGDFDGRALKPLPREGFYRIAAPFFCCAKQCVRFEPEQLVQLGYNGAGRAILFRPELAGGAITVPSTGTIIDDAALEHVVGLTVREREAPALEPFPRSLVVH